MAIIQSGNDTLWWTYIWVRTIRWFVHSTHLCCPSSPLWCVEKHRPVLEFHIPVRRHVTSFILYWSMYGCTHILTQRKTECDGTDRYRSTSHRVECVYNRCRATSHRVECVYIRYRTTCHRMECVYNRCRATSHRVECVYNRGATTSRYWAECAYNRCATTSSYCLSDHFFSFSPYPGRGCRFGPHQLETFSKPRLRWALRRPHSSLACWLGYLHPG